MTKITVAIVALALAFLVMLAPLDAEVPWWVIALFVFFTTFSLAAARYKSGDD